MATKVSTYQLNVSGTANSTTYLRGDGVWSSVSASLPEFIQAANSPINDTTLLSGNYSIILRNFKINSGKKIILSTGSKLRIL